MSADCGNVFQSPWPARERAGSCRPGCRAKAGGRARREPPLEEPPVEEAPPVSRAHAFIFFGQSNMWGVAIPEAVDMVTDDRVEVLTSTNWSIIGPTSGSSLGRLRTRASDDPGAGRGRESVRATPLAGRWPRPFRTTPSGWCRSDSGREHRRVSARPAELRFHAESPADDAAARRDPRNSVSPRRGRRQPRRLARSRQERRRSASCGLGRGRARSWSRAGEVALVAAPRSADERVGGAEGVPSVGLGRLLEAPRARAPRRAVCPWNASRGGLEPGRG